MNREKAREIAKEMICKDIKIEVQDSKESTFNFYIPQGHYDYWVVVIDRNCINESVESTEIIALSKENGKVLFHGEAE